jgi:hypothetical protein
VTLVTLVTLVTFACSTTATVVRRDGSELEGTINGGTPYGVIVTSEDGRAQEIRRDDITEIDHPGNVHAIVGSLFLLLSGMMLVGQSDSCDRNPPDDCWTFLVPGAVGAGLMIWGIPTWRSSIDAAGSSSMDPLTPHYGRPPTPRPLRGPGGELPPPPPAPPGYVGPAPSGAAPEPSLPPAPAAPEAPAPAPSAAPPPAEPEPGGVVW